MRRRALLLAGAALPFWLIAVSSPFADDGKGSSGEGSGSGKSGDGGDDHEDDDHNDDDDHGDGGEGDGNGGGGGSSADHNRAQAAVADEEALPLDRMLLIFRRSGNGTVIDVRLLRRNGTLTYMIKYIDGGGAVRRAYYDAATGDPVA
jgi:uncharacterized membrane protein YkoI